MIDKNIIPGHWEIKKLSESIEILDNLRQPINSSERQKRIAGKSEKELFPYYGATGQVGWIDGYLTDGIYVLVGEDGAPFLDNFKQKAYLIKGKSWVNNHAHVLKEKVGVTINEFILHYLNSINYIDFVNGTTRLKLTQGSLKEIPIPIPSISEQHLIVLKIEELFSELDKGKQQLQSAHQLLKVYRQSLFKANFKGKRSISFDEYVESSQNGLSKRKGITGEEFKVLRLADITDNMINDSDPRRILMDKNEISKYKIIEDDLICVRVNGSKDLVGKLIHASNKNEKDNWAFCDHFIRFKLDSSKAYAKFFHYYYSTLEVRKYIQENMVTSAGQNTVSQGTIKNVMVPDFSKDEQVNIVKELESKLSVCEMIEETLSRSLQLIESLRQSILKQAFEGKLI